MVDYNFFYKYSVRYILLNKLGAGVTNTYMIPFISKIVLFFSLVKIDDIDHVRGYNYAYLYKFFFGRRVFFSRQKSFFNLGKWTYSFNASLVISRSDVYKHLFFIINDLLPKVDKFYLSYGLFSKGLNIFYLVLKDLNIFSEKKTNLGLFFLDNNLNIHFHCGSRGICSPIMLFRNLKFNIY